MNNNKLFRLHIATPEKTVYEGHVLSLIAPGQNGYFGILINHAPLISILTPGKIVIKDANEKASVFVSKSGGFLEVHENNVDILIDSIEKG